MTDAAPDALRRLAMPEVLAMAAPLKPTEVFRLAATCAEHKCPHFDGADCRLATRVAKMLPPVIVAIAVIMAPIKVSDTTTSNG